VSTSVSFEVGEFFFPIAPVQYRFAVVLLDETNLSIETVDSTLTVPGQVWTYYLPKFSATSTNFVIPITNLKLTPKSPLVPGKRYRVSIIVQEFIFNNFFIDLTGYYLDRKSATETTGKKYFHWTSLNGADAQANVIGEFEGLSTLSSTRMVAIRNVAGKEGFTFTAWGSYARYDEFDTPLPAVPPANGNYFPLAIPFTYQCVLTDNTTNLPVALPNGGQFTTIETVPAFTLSAGKRIPYKKLFDRTLTLIPTNPADIIPGRTYSLTVNFRHTDPSLGNVSFGTRSQGGMKLISLSGKLRFGNVDTVFTSLSGNPATGAVTSLGGGQYRFPVTVPPGGGSVAAQPDQTFGGGPLTVTYQGQGDLVLHGNQTVQLLAGGSGTSAGVRWTRGPVVLGLNGATAQNFRVFLPAGFGYSEANVASIKGSARVVVSLDGSLVPSGTVTISSSIPGGNLCLAHERLPVRAYFRNIEWDVISGTFRGVSPVGIGGSALNVVHVRLLQIESLKNLRALNVFENGDDGTRKTNDGYLGLLGTISSFVVRTSSDGRALLDANYTATYDHFKTHFPRDLAISAGQTSFALQSSAVVSGSVVQTAATPVSLEYSTIAADSPACILGGGSTLNLSFTAANKTWGITPDGGLRANGTVPSQAVKWGLNPVGNYAHSVLAVRSGVMAVAGFALPSTAYPGTPELGGGYLPATLLLSGHGGAGNPATVERPFKPGYDSATTVGLAGRADYPGFNFRADITGGLRGESNLAASPTFSYGLQSYSKYYLRRGGVTGAHAAVTADVTPSPQFHGYNMALDGLRLAYLDTRNIASKTSGSVVLPKPSGFALAFSRLTFTSTGELENAELSNPGPKTLFYWNTGIDVKAISFASKNECVVAMGGAFLTLDVSASLPSITSSALHGRIGIDPTGNLVTSANAGSSGVDSRFILPARIEIAGINGSYGFSPVSKVALNNPFATGAPALGFASFAGNLSVPFFAEIPVHVHASSTTNADLKSICHIMGNWTEPNGRNFFNDPNFDPTNRGFPNVSLEDYRNNTLPAYRPIAHYNWRGVADLDYPMKWEPGGRFFTGAADDNDSILVLNVDHQLQRLTNTGCSITFGTGFQTPQLNVGSIAAELALGPAANALKKALPDPEGLIAGINGLDTLLTDRFQKTIDAPLNTALDAVAGEIVISLKNFYATSGPNGFENLQGSTLGSQGGVISQRIRDLVGSAGTLTRQIEDSLKDAETSCNLALAVIGTPTRRGEILAVVKKLSELGGTPVSAASASVMTESEDSLLQAQRIIEEAKQTLAALQGSSAIASRLTSAFSSASTAASNDAIAGVVASFRNAPDLTGNYMNEFTDAQLKARVLMILKQRVSGSQLADAAQPILRSAFQETSAGFRSAIDLMFAEVNRILNRTVRELTVPYVEAAFKELAGATGAVGETAAGVGDFCAAALVNGSAEINGNEIAKIRIDARLQLRVAGSLEVDGYFEMRNLASGTPSVTCRTPGAVATEVSMGANAKADYGLNVGFAVSLDGRFSFVNEGQLVGLDGSFDLRADMPVKQATISRFAAKFGFGSGVGYISGLAEGSLYFVDAQGRCFFGTTRNPLDLIYLDSDTLAVLGPNALVQEGPCLKFPVTGFYTGLEGSASVNEFFGIPDSCVLSLKAHLGSASFCFFQNRNGQPYIIPGVRYKLGLSGSVLCVLDLSGEGALAASAQFPVASLAAAIESPVSFATNLINAEATGTGRITLAAKIGIGPFSINPEKTLRLTMKLTRENVDVEF